MEQPAKMDLTSMNISEDKREQLRQLFPEVFTEKAVDFEKLKLVLGGMIDTDKERYGLNWAGKADCFKIIQQPSVGTLKPYRDESVNFDETENIFIEGDNLEVLKLLQKAYYGKVKMICIDPPYNTGNDFIYPDDYSESLDTYLKYTGQVDSEGRKYSTNTEADGRFHTKWINMMYPRLYLARNLLRDDGVIFIHIDDNEVHNLRKICDEIFGEENFVAPIIWQSKTGSNDAKAIDITTEYILVFAKNISNVEFSKNNAGYNISRYRYKDEFFETRGPYYLDTLDRGGLRYSDALNFGVDCPDGTKVFPNGRTEFINDGWTFKWSLAKIKWGIENKFIEIKKQKNGDSEWKVYYKVYLSVDNEGNVIERGSTYKNLITEIKTGRSSSELNSLFNFNVFKYSKPYEIIIELLSIIDTKNSIILDFFAGSATTAQAVLELNKEDGGNRRFILVQMPEPCDKDSEAFNAGYKTIADIGKERIRRVIKKIKEEKEGKLEYEGKTQDLGFKVFKLDRSNFKIWESATTEDVEKLGEQLQLHVDHIDPKSTQEDILYELLLKSGFDLATKTEKLTLAGKTVYSIADGAMLICLEEKLTKEVINAIAEMTPSRVICLDKGFKDNDQLKTNAVQIMKSKKVNTFLTV